MADGSKGDAIVYDGKVDDMEDVSYILSIYSIILSGFSTFEIYAVSFLFCGDQHRINFNS